LVCFFWPPPPRSSLRKLTLPGSPASPCFAETPPIALFEVIFLSMISFVLGSFQTNAMVLKTEDPCDVVTISRFQRLFRMVAFMILIALFKFFPRVQWPPLPHGFRTVGVRESSSGVPLLSRAVLAFKPAGTQRRPGGLMPCRLTATP